MNFDSEMSLPKSSSRREDIHFSRSERIWVTFGQTASRSANFEAEADLLAASKLTLQPSPLCPENARECIVQRAEAVAKIAPL